MQKFSSLLSWRLFTAQHVSGVFLSVIRSSTTAVACSGFTIVSWWQSYCVRGRAGRPARLRTQHDCHHDTKVKPEAATAVIELLMMDGKTPETRWVVNKCQDNKLENCCIWLVIYLKRIIRLIYLNVRSNSCAIIFQLNSTTAIFIPNKFSTRLQSKDYFQLKYNIYLPISNGNLN
jgi:hypothetical protein